MHKKLKRILLIDDDEINNELNQIMVEKFGYADETIVFESAIEALDYLGKSTEETLPELIFLDIKMPLMDGFQFMEAAQNMFKNFTKKIPVVFLTSSQNDKDIRKAKNYDIAGYINKPLTTEHLQRFCELP